MSNKKQKVKRRPKHAGKKRRIKENTEAEYWDRKLRVTDFSNRDEEESNYER